MSKTIKCTHPHIFRIQTREPYCCLSCGKVMKVDDSTSRSFYIDHAVEEYKQSLLKKLEAGDYPKYTTADGKIWRATSVEEVKRIIEGDK